MLDLLADINPADIVAYARQVPEEEDYLLTREIFPNVFRNSVRWRIRSTTRFAQTAQFRAYDTETPMGRRELETSVQDGLLPPLGQKLFVGELETILLNMDRGADNSDLVDSIYDDAETNVRAIRARLELAAGDLLTDGVFSLVDENGLTLEADFGVTAPFKPTATTFWTAALATPLTDEKAWIQYLIDNGDGRPSRVLAAHRLVVLLGSNHEYQEAYHQRGQAVYPTLTPAQVNSVREANSLPPITEYDTQVRVDGTTIRTIPDNRWIMITGGRGDLGETQYGTTAEALALSRDRRSNPRITREDQPGIIVTARESDDPVQVWTKGTAVAMPLLYRPKGLIIAKVAA